MAEYLSQRLGLKKDQITVIGMGPDEPVGDNTTEAGRADNRRVHVDLIRETNVADQDLVVNKAGEPARWPLWGCARRAMAGEGRRFRQRCNIPTSSRFNQTVSFRRRTTHCS